MSAPSNAPKLPKLSPQQRARLRVCASCRWIYKVADVMADHGCPKCGGWTYGARWVFGNQAYLYAWTQKPWLDHQLDFRRGELLGETYRHQMEHQEQKPIRGRRADCLIFDDSLA